MTDDYDFCSPIRDNEEMYGELEEEAADARLEARRRNAFWDAFDRGELFEPSTPDEDDE